MIIINLIKSGEGKGEGRGGEGASLSGSLASHHSALTERLTSRVLYTFVGRKYSPVRFTSDISLSFILKTKPHTRPTYLHIY